MFIFISKYLYLEIKNNERRWVKGPIMTMYHMTHHMYIAPYHPLTMTHQTLPNPRPHMALLFPLPNTHVDPFQAHGMNHGDPNTLSLQKFLNANRILYMCIRQCI